LSTVPPLLLASPAHTCHVGLHRHAKGVFVYAVGREDLPLAVRSAAAVAAHRRDDERLRSEIAEYFDGGPHDGRQIGDAATTDSDGDAVSVPQSFGKARGLPL